VLAGTPISSLSVTLRGQKYDVSDVSTVEEIQEKVSTLSGISIKQQGRVIYGGKKLTSDTVLSEAGISDGAHLNIVPSTSSKKKKPKTTTITSSAETSAATTKSTSAQPSSNTGNNLMSDLLKNAGIDQKDLDEMMKSMGGEAGAGGPKSMEEGMKAMQEAMKSPLLQQMLQDPEKLEQSRQMILNNPMLKSMMSNMPGMNDLLNDKDAWRQAMQMAAELYKNMDSDTLMKAMMGGAEAAQNSMMNGGGSGASGTGSLFDGSQLFSDSTNPADKPPSMLDELDEDE
jgi:Ubiquitin family